MEQLEGELGRMSAALAPAPAAGGLRIHVTDRPTSPASCTPELAAWLVIEEGAVGYLDDDGCQCLHLPGMDGGG